MGDDVKEQMYYVETGVSVCYTGEESSHVSGFSSSDSCMDFSLG